VPILALQKNEGSGSGIVHCQNDDGAGMVDDIAACSHAVRFFDVVGGHRENRATIYRARGDDTFFASLGAAGGSA
jgi:hypothetical protein